MRKHMFAMGFVAMAAAFSVPSALQACDDSSSGRDGGTRMMGQGTMKGGMMNGMGRMSQMMDHCSHMMSGTSTRPNEQWRDDTRPGGNQSPEKQ